ncbi:MAG: type I-B CRISPR-associated protein Cas7/Cst2/DevR [Candidatus Aenigmatarchaeota archaeon]
MDTDINKKDSGKRFIVLDIVFYGSSLNYDQGTGNYHELKKITKWDGRQYTLVSRYALRYSILETGRDLGYWMLADASKFQLAGQHDKKVIQPSEEVLLSGEILAYPEFDLFGYLITTTTPQNFRESPVKISHAVSLTPFNYDVQFAGNLGLANRIKEDTGELQPNLFNTEEHVTYYVYTVVIDVDRIGKNEVYISREKKDIKIENNQLIITTNVKDKKRGNEKEEEKKVPLDNRVETKILKGTNDNDKVVYILSQELKNKEEIKNRIINLVKAILNLRRNIKGRSEFLDPKILILGFYKNVPYKSFKDRIQLANEYVEIYEEETEQENGKKKRIIRRVLKLDKPCFTIVGLGKSNQNLINEESIIKKIEDFLKDSNSQQEPEVMIYRSPETEIKIQ